MNYNRKVKMKKKKKYAWETTMKLTSEWDELFNSNSFYDSPVSLIYCIFCLPDIISSSSVEVVLLCTGNKYKKRGEEFNAFVFTDCVWKPVSNNVCTFIFRFFVVVFFFCVAIIIFIFRPLCEPGNLWKMEKWRGSKEKEKKT